MLAVYICDLLVDISQLHMILIHFVVIDYFIDLFHPLIVKEHRIVALCYYLLTAHELIVLRLESKPKSLDVGFLFEPALSSAQSCQHISKIRRTIAYHFFDEPQKSIFAVIFLKRFGQDLRRSKDVQE